MRQDWQAKKNKTTTTEANNANQIQADHDQTQSRDELLATQVGTKLMTKRNGLEEGTSTSGNDNRFSVLEAIGEQEEEPGDPDMPPILDDMCNIKLEGFKPTPQTEEA